MEERANSPDGSLERRLALLRSLAEEIEQAQTALLHSDPHAIESHTARQRDICLQLQADRQQQDSSIPWHERRAGLRKELATVEQRVWYLNRVYSALLARASRSLAILERILASSSMTYVAATENVGAGVRR